MSPALSVLPAPKLKIQIAKHETSPYLETETKDGSPRSEGPTGSPRDTREAIQNTLAASPGWHFSIVSAQKQSYDSTIVRLRDDIVSVLRQQKADLCRRYPIQRIALFGSWARDEFKRTHAEVPWPKMAGLRNRIVHDYVGIDQEIVWHIIQNELIGLKSDIQSLL